MNLLQQVTNYQRFEEFIIADIFTFPQQEPGSQACEPPEERLVFSKTCKNFDPFQTATEEQREQNQVVTDRLTETAGAEKVQIFTSHICDVYLWIVELTDNEVADLLANTPEIQAIERNQPASFSSYGADRRNSRSRVKRQDTTVKFYRKAPIHLVFISTPPRDTLPRKYYAYDSSAGDGIVIYHFDTGVFEAHNEIRRLNPTMSTELSLKPMVTGFLFGSGLDRQDRSDYGGFGTCRLSLVGGRRFGVSKKASAVVVKVAQNTGSVLTGMMATMDDLPKSAPGVTAGRYVIDIGLQWQDNEANPESKESLLHFLRLFTGPDFQIPVVVPLGDEPAYPNAYMDALPAILSSDNIPLITVGAVDPVQGATYPWSKKGDRNSIYAPGMVACADNMERQAMNGVFGTDKAAALVAGLVVYFLGLPGVGDQLREDPLGVVLAMRRFLAQQGSWVRQRGKDRAIWNLNRE